MARREMTRMLLVPEIGCRANSSIAMDNCSQNSKLGSHEGVVCHRCPVVPALTIPYERSRRGDKEATRSRARSSHGPVRLACIGFTGREGYSKVSAQLLPIPN